jgi:membrane-bound ClpP family serine protease
LYTQPGDPVAPAVSVSNEVIVAMTTLTGLVVAGILYAAWRSRHMPQIAMGVGHITTPLVAVGSEASVRRDLVPVGTVYASGEEWTARSADGSVLDRGTPVRVVGHDGLKLIVERWRPDDMTRRPATRPSGPTPAAESPAAERMA